MSSFVWTDVINNNKNSVVHIHSTVRSYDCTKPYITNDTLEMHGTGFVIDIKKGIIGTHYSLVKNAVAVSGFIPLFNKVPLKLEVMSVCPVYELALLLICQEDLEGIINQALEDPTILNLEFDDSMYVKSGEDVLIIGYNDNKNVECSTYKIAGRCAVTKVDYDMYYLYLSDYPLENRRGAPVFNTNGKIIGINAFRGCFIPSRMLLCVYSAMLLNNGIFTPPMAGLTYGNLNQDFINIKTNTNTDMAIITGVQVRNVNKNSFLDQIDKGSIISSVTYQDPFIARDKICSLRHALFVENNGHVEPELRNLLGDCFEEFRNSKGERFPDRLNLLNTDLQFPSITVSAHIDNYGNLQLYELDFLEVAAKLEAIDVEHPVTPLIDKRFKLEEFFYMLDLGTELEMKVFYSDYKGQAGWFGNSSVFTSENTCSLDHIDYTFTEPKFEIVAGCCFININLDVMEKFKITMGKHNVAISQIFQNTGLYEVGDFVPGDIVVSINNREIKTISDVRTAMKNCPVYFNMKTKNDKEFIYSREDMLQEDLDIIKIYKIHDYVHPLSEREEIRMADPNKPVKQLRKL